MSRFEAKDYDVQTLVQLVNALKNEIILDLEDVKNSKNVLSVYKDHPSSSVFIGRAENRLKMIEELEGRLKAVDDKLISFKEYKSKMKSASLALRDILSDTCGD